MGSLTTAVAAFRATSPFDLCVRVLCLQTAEYLVARDDGDRESAVLTQIVPGPGDHSRCKRVSVSSNALGSAINDACQRRTSCGAPSLRLRRRRQPIGLRTRG